jgi:hypothetical protein
MKGFIGILPAPPEIANWLQPIFIAESVQSLARDVELKEIVSFRKVKNRWLFKVGNTSRASPEFPFRDELSANPKRPIVSLPQVQMNGEGLFSGDRQGELWHPSGTELSDRNLKCIGCRNNQHGSR